jgi:hypothetical protein
MNDGTQGTRKQRRWAWRHRAGVLAAVVAAIAPLAVACTGGGSPPVAAGDTAYQSAAAYARCMRFHGAPNWPDPTSKGQFVKTLANRAEFSAPASAYKACQHLLPHGGQITPAEQQKISPLMLKFAECMRSRGITNMPDPAVDSQGVTFGISPASKGELNPHSPQFQAAQQACQKYTREAAKYMPPG